MNIKDRTSLYEGGFMELKEIDYILAFLDILVY